jgi:hypothetical protein
MNELGISNLALMRDKDFLDFLNLYRELIELFAKLILEYSNQGQIKLLKEISEVSDKIREILEKHGDLDED